MGNACYINKKKKKILKFKQLEKKNEISLNYYEKLEEKENKEVDGENKIILNNDKKLEEKENKENKVISSVKNELKIELYPENKPRNEFIREPLNNLLKNENKDILGYSFDKEKYLAFINTNVPLLNGFYTAHTNHHPIRIKPDDIWLLIVQAFSNHVNANSEELRKYFVNFDYKKTLTVKYLGIYYAKNVDKKILENFVEQISEQMKEYLGEEILENLTPKFTTTNYDSTIICKLSIMSVFKKYFNYCIEQFICGIPYIILEGTAEDYKKIINKANYLRKYKFEWYIDRIIPHIQKMVEAKEGKIDVEHFQNIIQKKEIIENRRNGCLNEIYEVKVDQIFGWILKFFAYYNEKEYNGKRFNEDSIKVEDFNKLSNQMLIVPFTIIEEITGKEYSMKYKVGFIGCDQNKEKEVYPVQGWLVSKY